jgi:spore germination cell wall hydrolase CwlJ-like protein
MTNKKNDAISRSDRVLVAALAIILATASAAVGSALTYRPADVLSAAQRAAVSKQISAAAVAPVRNVQDGVATQLLAEHRCLSEVLYYEARGEGRGGQQAIAEVVFHRMNTGNYGHSICAVVYEGAGHPGCQFSFTCNGQLALGRQASAWKESEKLAAQILTGEVRLQNATGGATNFHAISASPDWAPTLEKTIQIGNHIFYRGGVTHSRDS